MESGDGTVRKDALGPILKAVCGRTPLQHSIGGYTMSFNIVAELEKVGKFELADKLRTLASEPNFWKKQYSKDLPHWMESNEPSKLADRFLELIPKKSRVLEIGVGNGRDSIYFSKKGHSVVGIDIAERPVQEAKKAASKEKQDIIFLQMDAEDLKFHNDFFDGVYTLSVLHSTDVFKSFKEVSRVLKEGGIFLAFMYLGTEDLDGNTLAGNHEKLSSIIVATEVNNFSIADLYVNMEEDKVDDEHDEPHTHKVLVIILEKGGA